ncbi:50S ribosomal protein L11 methyltransferase [Deferribacteres bacterium DY0037]
MNEKVIHNIPLRNGKTAQIYQGAFGSGEHETTRACIKHLETMSLSGKKVLDVGCGTGILGICASLLGAKDVYGYDISWEACKTAVECNKLNNISDYHIICGFQDCISGVFDIIFANIYFDILIDISGFIKDSMANGGLLVLSGIPIEFNYDVRAHYIKCGFEVIRLQIHEDFSTVLLKKTSEV